MEAKLNSKTRKLTVFFFLSIFLMISISAVAATTNDTPQWSKQANDNQNTGQSQNIGPQNNTTKWNKSFTENDSAISGPVVGHDGTIYIQSTDYKKNLATLHAINPDGSTKWTYSLEDLTK